MKPISFFQTDYPLVNTNLTPSIKRKERFQLFINALTSPLAWNNSNLFNEYSIGSNAPFYDEFTTYNIGDKVIDIDNAVYECFQNGTYGIEPIDGYNPLVWQLVSQDFRGVLERLRYTGQKLHLEYILNNWFHTSWVQPDSQNMPMTTRPYIYIDNNLLENNVFTVFDNDTQSSSSYYFDIYSQAFVVDTYSFVTDGFTIYVPSGFYAALGSFAEQKIRAIADLYVIAGIKYNIDTY